MVAYEPIETTPKAKPNQMVYLVRSVDTAGVEAYKIGRGGKNRVRDLQTGNQFDLEVLAQSSFMPWNRAKGIEAGLHIRYSYVQIVRRNGSESEWFWLDTSEVEYLTGLISVL